MSQQGIALIIMRMSKQLNKMRKKILDNIAIGVFIILLVGSLWIAIKVPNFFTPSEKDPLEWYRSDDLPVDCRLPEYEGDIEGWKINLRHDQAMWYCLKYFE